ncbi:hypothetical protein [Candidatus Contendibacter odensensis]|uniref:Uncharacterized protein n=1 Tax=Candidatus Contendobacter odensis Run_B_J11 TaxID=1400861 RepID=A0A7U7GEH1_9GAMM|nr:hypothetical protein [Candidatus Contendobacter odensis]CDH46366.1 hypothetical protein BN874_450004 [Candidatus Contendobacter odensis Run_B_J11]
MTEHDQQSSGVEAVTNAQPSQGRRRWVKGAMLATPAVMTLFHGRLAMASAICSTKAVPAQPGWVDQNIPPNQLDNVGPNGALGYIDKDDNFVPAPLGDQNAFHSAACWGSVQP